MIVGVRSEDLVPTTAGEHSFAVEVDMVEELGSDTYVYGSSSSGLVSFDRSPLVVRLPKGESPRRGERLWVTADPSRARLFDAQTQLAIS